MGISTKSESTTEENAPNPSDFTLYRCRMEKEGDGGYGFSLQHAAGSAGKYTKN